MAKPLRLLCLAAGAAVLVLLVARIGPQMLVELLRRVRWTFAAVSILYALHLGVRALALWRALPPGLSYGDVLRVRLSGEAIEMLTFTGPLLAEPAKGWLLTQRGLTGADAFGGVAIEYLLYTLVSAWMAAIALALLISRGALPVFVRTPVAGIVSGVAAFTVGCLVAAVTGVGLIVPTVRGLGAIAGPARDTLVGAAVRIEPVERVLVTFMHRQPARLAEVLGIEIAGHALLAMEIWIVVGALGFPFGFGQALILEGAVKFIGVAFFFVPGQIGVSESVYSLLFAAIGLPGAVGLTMALVRRVRGIIVAGAGLATLTLTRRP